MVWIKKLFDLFNYKQKIIVFVLVIVSIGAALLDTISTYIILPFVYAIMDSGELSSGTMGQIYTLLNCSNNDEFIVKLALIIAVLYLFIAVYKVFDAALIGMFRNGAQHKLSVRIFEKTIDTNYKDIIRINSSEIQRIIGNDVDRVNAVVVQLMNIISSILTGGVLIAVLWLTDKAITIFATLVIFFVIFVINKPISQKAKEIGHKISLTRTKMVKITQQYFGGYKVLIACGRQNAIKNQFVSESLKNSTEYLKRSILEAIPQNVTQGLIMASIFAYMACVSITGVDMSSMLPKLATFALAAMKLLPLVGRISTAFIAIKVDIPAIDAIYNFLYSKNMQEGNKVIESVSSTNDYFEFKEGIFVENISFKFDDAEKELFSKVSLKIPVNKSVAFIGPTGAGKTTLADIIVGLYLPQEGRVRADNIDIHKNIEWWASQIGYISQQIYLLDDTIRNNVVYGYDNEDEVDDERIWRCLEDACIDDYVKGLPDGLDTICGENGVRFSGGQKQRLGIARALYSRPSVLVFDEATSALDTETEASIVKSIDNLAGKKTIIIIAHRLSTIENCDIVYKISENGITTERE